MESNLDYKSNPKHDFGGLKGEFDVIAYFEKENVIFPIQVKLSNVNPRTEKRKEEWVDERIRKEGVKQIKNDTTLLQMKLGLEFISESLKTNKTIKNPQIYPLIVTDNFFADHVSFSYNEKNEHVICVSYFELKHLLLNQKIHDKQADWQPFNTENIVCQLIEMIENNSFWNFLEKSSEKFKLNKTLFTINEENKIEIII
ncbi:MAG TPA: hypothetical protein PLP27_00150 [Crocinitomicaceae bacterium]|nr:hypothetical protein [Crocinitomicaceae bacterium]